MKKIIISTIILLLIIVGGTFWHLSTTDTTPISHHWENYKTWYKSSGSEAITGDKTKFLGGKHRDVDGYRVIYINDVGVATNKRTRPYKYPEGTVIVKEQYKDASSYKNKRRPDLTIMIKLSEGESPETGDWGYTSGFKRKIHKNLSSQAKFCGDCHKAANLKKSDYVFINSTNH